MGIQLVRVKLLHVCMIFAIDWSNVVLRQLPYNHIGVLYAPMRAI